MSTILIREGINKAIIFERRSNQMKERLKRRLRIYPSPFSPNEIDKALHFIIHYVREAPLVLDDMRRLSGRYHIQNQMDPVLTRAENYFLEPYDVIPDHLGIKGFLDDAYMTHQLVQALSEIHYEKIAVRMIPVDRTHDNLVVRWIIGEPRASQIDTIVNRAIAGNGSEIPKTYLSRIRNYLKWSRTYFPWTDEEKSAMIFHPFNGTDVLAG